MKAPISWLQDFVKIDIPAEALADKLVHAGFEVEEIIREADAIKNVVTGRVLAMERHPNSDHLWICQIKRQNRNFANRYRRAERAGRRYRSRRA